MNKEKIKNDILSALNASKGYQNFKYEYVGETITSSKKTFHLIFTIGSNENFGIIVSQSGDDDLIYLEVCTESLTSYFTNEVHLNELIKVVNGVSEYVNAYNKWFKLPTASDVNFSNSTLTFEFKNTTDFSLSLPYIEEYEQTLNEKKIMVYFLDIGANFEIFFGDNPNPIRVEYAKVDDSLVKELKNHKDEYVKLAFGSETHTVEFESKFDLIPIFEPAPTFYDEGETPPVSQ